MIMSRNLSISKGLKGDEQDITFWIIPFIREGEGPRGEDKVAESVLMDS